MPVQFSSRARPAGPRRSRCFTVDVFERGRLGCRPRDRGCGDVDMPGDDEVRVVADDWEMLRNARFGDVCSHGLRLARRPCPGCSSFFGRPSEWSARTTRSGSRSPARCADTVAIASFARRTCSRRAWIVFGSPSLFSGLSSRTSTASLMWASTLNVLVAVLLLMIGLHRLARLTVAAHPAV